MFDLRAIRERPDDFRTGWTRRKVEGDPVGHILKMDEERRSVQTKLQELQATRNAEAAKISKIKKEGGDDSAQLAPDIPEALPEVTNDGKTYTCTPRKGVQFANGK